MIAKSYHEKIAVPLLQKLKHVIRMLLHLKRQWTLEHLRETYLSALGDILQFFGVLNRCVYFASAI